jgi:hypothetical protein
LSFTKKIRLFAQQLLCLSQRTLNFDTLSKAEKRKKQTVKMTNDYENENGHHNDNIDNDCNSVYDDDSCNSVKPTRRNTEIGTKETKDVVCLRFVVFLVLFVSALSVAIIVFVTIRKEEKEKFRDTYSTEVTKLFESFTISLKNMVGSLDMLSTTVVSHARDSNSTWPFVTIPDFPNRVSKHLSTGAGVILTMSVIVEPNDRLKWEEYAMNNSDIVPKALHIMETDKNCYGEVNWTYRNEPVVVEVADTYRPIPYNTT